MERFEPITAQTGQTRSNSRSSRQSRSSHRSRSRSRRPSLSRVYSSRHFDDHSVYGYGHEVVGDPQQEDDAASHHSDVSRQSSQEKSTSEGPGEEYEEQEEFDSKIVDEKDVEARPNLVKSKSQRSTRSTKDPNVVSWTGPDDPDNPKNWSMHKKWVVTFIVSCFTFISPVSSSMVAPALPSMSRELGIRSDVESQLSLSIFVLAYAIGPLFLGPLSEVYGRVHVLQLSNLFFLAWNIGCSFAQTPGQMIAFRFLSGLGGSAPLSIGGGVLSDCWRADERGKAMSIYALAPLIGPAIGPVAGGFIAENATWRWVFWSTSIADVVIQLAGLSFLEETYAPTLLHRRASKLKKETGNEKLRSEYESEDWKLSKVLRTALSRPFKFMFTQPIIQAISVYMAFLYGLMYIVISTLTTLWTEKYGQSVSIGGLNYIALGLGFTLGTQICAPINDRIYRKLTKRNNNVGRPEFRIPLMFIGSALVPIGLFWYAWSAETETFWIVPDIGNVIWTAGAIINFQCMQTYIIDSYTRYAASGVAAAVFLRSIAGFGFPLFAPYMYQSLGYGWGNSLMGFLAVVLGIPAPFLFWFYGERLRARSKFSS